MRERTIREVAALAGAAPIDSDRPAGPDVVVDSRLATPGARAGRIDAVAFVESIPFSETRGYVKNVLSYDAYYRYFMGQQDKILSDAEWRQRY